MASTQILINKHEQLEDEIKFRGPRIDKMISLGEKLIDPERFKHDEIPTINSKISDLQVLFKQLKELSVVRRSLLEDSFSSQQYFADANEVFLLLPSVDCAIKKAVGCNKTS